MSPSRDASAREVPSVSLCIPTCNGERYLAEALDSALGQSHADMEILVVDDASTDSTVEIITDFMRRDGRIVLHENPTRLGLVGNWNHCVQLARGEWVKFLFQDDILAPSCIDAMLQAGRHPGTMLVACDRHFHFEPDIDAGFRERFTTYVEAHHFDRIFPGSETSIDAGAMARRAADEPNANFVGEPTAVMFRRSVTKALGLFNRDLQQIPDWEFWLRIGVNHGIRRIPRELVTFRLHGRGATHANVEQTVRRDLLDGLLLLHDVAFNPLFAPVQQAARHQHPPIDLQQRVFDEWVKVGDLLGRAQADRAMVPSIVQTLWRELPDRYPAIGRREKAGGFSRLRALLSGFRHRIGIAPGKPS